MLFLPEDEAVQFHPSVVILSLGYNRDIASGQLYKIPMSDLYTNKMSIFGISYTQNGSILEYQCFLNLPLDDCIASQDQEPSS